MAFSPLGAGAALGLGGALLEAVSGFLLIPVFDAAIRMDFSSLGGSRVVAAALRIVPTLASHQGEALFIRLLAISLVVAFGKTFLMVAASSIFAREVHEFSGRLRQAAFARCLRASKSFFDESNVGKIQSDLTAQVNLIAAQSLVVHEALTHLALLAAYLLVMTYISWKLTMLAAMFIPVAQLLSNRLNTAIRSASMAASDAQRLLSARISGALSNHVTVRAEGGARREMAEFAQATVRLESALRFIALRVTVFPRLQESVFLLMILVLLVGVALQRGAAEAAAIPPLFVFVYAARRASISAMAASRARTALAAASGAVADVCSLLETAARNAVAFGPVEFRGVAKALEVRSLSFSYPDGRRALQGVSFKVAAGESVALVGPSGSGKTTLLNVLLRAYPPPRGAVFVDGTDLLDFSEESFARLVAHIPQDCQPFDSSLKTNLTYPEDRWTAREHAAALSAAQLWESVQGMPQGLETPVGESGVRLSGGERQRLALARAVLKGADLFLLDEATSALDSVTESEIQLRLAREIKGRTSIIVAHRLATVQGADRIIVLDDGRIVESGSFSELRGAGGAFRRLVEAQAFQ